MSDVPKAGESPAISEHAASLESFETPVVSSTSVVESQPVSKDDAAKVVVSETVAPTAVEATSTLKSEPTSKELTDPSRVEPWDKLTDKLSQHIS